MGVYTADFKQIPITSADVDVFVSATLPTVNTETAWKALDVGTTFVEVNGVTDAGSYGGTYDLISVSTLDDGTVMKAKGQKNPGTASMSVVVLKDNGGQAILEEFANKREPIGVKYRYGNGDVDYFAALVMGWDKTVGGPNDVVTASPTLELIAAPVYT